MIEYEFDILNFSAAEGEKRFQVVDGKLTLESEPDEAMIALIERHGGKRIEQKKRTKKASAKNEVDE